MRLALILAVAILAILGLLIVVLGHQAVVPFESRLNIIVYGLLIAAMASALLWMAL